MCVVTKLSAKAIAAPRCQTRCTVITVLVTSPWQPVPSPIPCTVPGSTAQGPLSSTRRHRTRSFFLLFFLSCLIMLACASSAVAKFRLQGLHVGARGCRRCRRRRWPRRIQATARAPPAGQRDLLRPRSSGPWPGAQQQRVRRVRGFGGVLGLVRLRAFRVVGLPGLHRSTFGSRRGVANAEHPPRSRRHMAALSAIYSLIVPALLC